MDLDLRKDLGASRWWWWTYVHAKRNVFEKVGVKYFYSPWRIY